MSWDRDPKTTDIIHGLYPAPDHVVELVIRAKPVTQGFRPGLY
ncbi:MAG: hypothetical protein QNJ58_22160 [Desulfobacterales bacterium]|nr:hypothetical protein [Desulfobacterales bacterium]